MEMTSLAEGFLLLSNMSTLIVVFGFLVLLYILLVIKSKIKKKKQNAITPTDGVNPGPDNRDNENFPQNPR